LRVNICWVSLTWAWIWYRTSSCGSCTLCRMKDGRDMLMGRSNAEAEPYIRLFATHDPIAHLRSISTEDIESADTLTKRSASVDGKTNTHRPQSIGFSSDWIDPSEVIATSHRCRTVIHAQTFRFIRLETNLCSVT
jgi:hypothetical protein